MRKLRNLIGMPVICRRRRLGRLVQADLSPSLTQLEGIWVDGGLRGTRYIPAEQLSMIGEMAIMSDSCGKRRRCAARNMLLRAVSTDGRRMGAIVDAEVDELSFLVRALELSRGFWDDLRRGRSRVERFHLTAESGEVVLLDSVQETEREDET